MEKTSKFQKKFARQILELKNGRKKPFDVEAQLKYLIARNYGEDANEFLWRIEMTSDPENSRLSFRAKRFVEMLMAAECALKSTRISLSQIRESPDDAYKVVRSSNHGLSGLAEKVRVLAKNRVKFLDKNQLDLLEKASSVGIPSRYSVDVYAMTSNETVFELWRDSGKITSTIGNDVWLGDFLALVYRLVEISRISLARCEKYTVMTFLEQAETQKRFQKFVQDNRVSLGR